MKKPTSPLSKTFDFRKREPELYAEWEAAGFFKADAHSKKKPFSLVMPPPNATGKLHLGHAARLTVEDIMARANRMRGKEVLWIPGTDHAAIATEALVIKNLQEAGIKDPRKELGREKLLEEIKTFVEQSRGTIRQQVRRMGASCDWSRERYTMEDALSRLVNEVFARMYGAGLIYRGQRIINWDPKMQTVVSDDEIEHKSEKAPFYYFKYGPFEIGTSRPETKFGDKYVVVHPDDPRYAKYADGETFTCEWINGPITATVIKDVAVDMTFGSGAMTITPWHDMTDFEIAKRHDLDSEQIIGYDGRLLEVAGEFAGMKIADARPKIVEKLNAKGLLTRTDDAYTHNVAVSYRGKGVIEPQVKEQWFVDVNKRAVDWKDKKMSLKEVMQDVVRSGDIKILPKRFEKLYFHWIDNLRDWCISRQIWWGHRIPVWYHQNSGEMKVGAAGWTAQRENPGQWSQDPDTLDTWFSSALWTWSTMIDPKTALDPKLSLEQMLAKSPDFQKFHPTDVLETAYEILFFWVARMILTTTFVTGQIPFRTVYLGGLILTRDGKKMSKSDPKQAINPLDVIDSTGADALRLSMVVGSKPGQNIRVYQEKIDGFRNFTNKLWNLGKFVMARTSSASSDDMQLELSKLPLADRWILSRLHRTMADTTKRIDAYQFGEAGKGLVDFVWNDLADWYVEVIKTQNSPESNQVLGYVFSQSLKLLHPFIPFITEELWAHMHSDAQKLIVTPWPTPYIDFVSDETEQAFSFLQEIIGAVRNIRSEYKIQPAKQVSARVYIPTTAAQFGELFQLHQKLVGRLAHIASFEILKTADTTHAPRAVVKSIELVVPLEQAIDSGLRKKELSEERDRIVGFIASVEKKLSNTQFVSHAPAAVIEKEQQKLADQQAKLAVIDKELVSLS